MSFQRARGPAERFDDFVADDFVVDDFVVDDFVIDDFPVDGFVVDDFAVTAPALGLRGFVARAAKTGKLSPEPSAPS